MTLLSALSSRALVHQYSKGLEEALARPCTFYLGIDPTAPSLHIGNLVPIMVLKHLQQNGHKPILLLGGATGSIGDPSGRTEERALMDKAQIVGNIERIEAQIKRLLSDHLPLPEIVNNYEWFKDISFLDFARDTGKHITVNYMLSKESVRKRMATEQGISFTEFTYQLIQGYDFLHLYRTHHCVLQIGGADQWGNMLTGVELVRRKLGKEAFVLTTPLLTKADGEKFGKSAGGSVWLDAALTSPFSFYQFWLNAADEDSEQWLRIFTFLNLEGIAALATEHKTAPHQRLLQKKLAYEVTAFIHGVDAAQGAQEASEKLFSPHSGSDFLKNLTEQAFNNLTQSMPYFSMKKEQAMGSDFPSVLAESGVVKSKTEARRYVQSGSVWVNKDPMQATDTLITREHLLFERYILVQVGKKNYFLIELL